MAEAGLRDGVGTAPGHGPVGGLRAVDGPAVGEAGDGGDDDGKVGGGVQPPAGTLLGAEAGGDGPRAGERRGYVLAQAGGEARVEGALRGRVGAGEDETDGDHAAGGGVGVRGTQDALAAERPEGGEQVLGEYRG